MTSTPPTPGLCASCAKRQGKRIHWCGDRLGCTCSCSGPTRGEKRVLLALLADTGRWFAYPLSQTAQAGSGTVYAVLWRLEGHGWVTSGWALGPEPRRRWYTLTPPGREHVAALLGVSHAEDGPAPLP